MKRIVFGFAGALLGTSATALSTVDLELSLVVDVSGSVSSQEFDIQQQGYVQAFQNQSVIDAITASSTGIAVNLIYFASSAIEAIPFTLLTDAPSISAFAQALNNAGRPSSSDVGSGTDIFDGVNLATDLLGSNMFEGTRVTIDVSGDGTDSVISNQTARDRALANGVTNINGLPIGSTAIENFFRDNVIGGDGAFLEPASNFADFDAAVARKVSAEISVAVPAPPVPPAPTPPAPTNPSVVPTPSAAVAGLGMMGLGLLRRRRSA